MATHDAEVIVVGGGPAGAATAFFLARAGLDVLVLDRAHFPRDKPCSEYLSPQASRLLHELGLLESLERGPSAKLAGMRISSPNGTTFEGMFGAVKGFSGFRSEGLSVRRPILDHAILSRAREVGARVREGAQVRDVARDTDGRIAGVTVAVEGRVSTLRAPLVIGADGLRSVVARRTGLGAHGRWPSRLALVTHYAGVSHERDIGEMHVLRGGYLGIAPVGGGLTNVALVVPTWRRDEIRGDPAPLLDRTIDQHPAIAARLAGAGRVAAIRAVGPFNWRARIAVAPGVALVGDAADFFDPFTGEGIYAAMRGAELLTQYAWEAARAANSRAHVVALEAYDRCRRNEFAGKWAVERAIGTAVAWPGLMNLAAAALARRPELADTLVGVTGDFVPASEVLSPGYIFRLLVAAIPFGSRKAPVREPLPAAR